MYSSRELIQEAHPRSSPWETTREARPGSSHGELTSSPGSSRRKLNRGARTGVHPRAQPLSSPGEFTRRAHQRSSPMDLTDSVREFTRGDHLRSTAWDLTRGAHQESSNGMLIRAVELVRNAHMERSPMKLTRGAHGAELTRLSSTGDLTLGVHPGAPMDSLPWKLKGSSRELTR